MPEDANQVSEPKTEFENSIVALGFAFQLADLGSL